MFPVESMYVDSAHIFPILQRLTKSGMNESTALRALGFKRSCDHFTDIPDLVSLKEFVNSVELAKEFSQDPLFAIKAGAEQSVGDFSTLAQLAFFSRDLQQVIDLYCKYLAAFNPGFPTRIEKTDHISELPIVNKYFSVEEAAALMEFRIAACLRMIRVVTFNFAKDVVDHVKFPHSPTAPIEEYEKLLNTKVLFNQEYCAFAIKNDALEVKIPTHNQSMLQDAVNRAEILRNKQGLNSDEMILKVQALIRSGLATGKVALDDIAPQLSMSKSTLKRYLTSRKLSFQKLLDDERRNEIRHLLTNTNLPAQEIAKKAGLASPASLTQVCQRLFNCTPSMLRNPK